MPRFPAPGCLVDVGGRAIHMRFAGHGPLTVVFDAALAASSLSWALVEPKVASFTRTCVYDRAGFGWSDPGPLPRTAGRAADELHLALDRSGQPPPYLLVGHSYGGLVARVFAARYRTDVAGMVLVDPAHPEDWLDPEPKEQARIDLGVRLCGQGRLITRLGIAHVVSWLVGIGAVPAARRLVNVLTRRTIAPDMDRILAPFFKLPQEVRAPVRRFWTRQAFYEALGSQIASMPETSREVLEAAAAGYGDLPLVTISRANLDEHTRCRQDAVAHLSSRGRHVVATQGGHWVPLDDPELVVEVTREMVDLHRDTDGEMGWSVGASAPANQVRPGEPWT